MANSGPHTNGSQFFITDTARPNLNGVHTVFGTISSGQAVVDAINEVPTDANAVPTTPVVIHSISIRREGAAALAFDELAQGLPIVSNPNGRLEKLADNKMAWNFGVPLNVGTIFRVFRSPSLAINSWIESENYEYHLGLPGATDNLPVANLPIDQNTAPTAFYNLSVETHSDAFGPSTLANRTVTIPLSGGVLTLAFNATSRAGTTTYTPTSGAAITSPFTTESFSTGAHHVHFVSNSPDLNPRYLMVKIGCDSATSTTISGRHSTQAFNNLFGWQPFAAGVCTITR
jgi:hypothetical protein